MNRALSAAEITHFLDDWLQTEFTFLLVADTAETLAGLTRREQDFVLDWTRRIATTNIQIAYEFASQAAPLMGQTDRQILEAWALHAVDTYDQAGLFPGLAVIRDLQRFLRFSHAQTVGVVLENVRGVLLTFVRGLSGRALKLSEDDAVYTDSETLYLPPVIAELPSEKDNFNLSKIMVTLLWAQTRFGTFRADLEQALSTYPDPAHALRIFNALETLRLEACIGRELPGLYREIQRLKQILAPEQVADSSWQNYAAHLAHPAAAVEDSLRLTGLAYPNPLPHCACYQGELRLAEIAHCMKARQAKEKILLRVKLAQIAEEMDKKRSLERNTPAKFELQESDPNDLMRLELTLDDMPIAPHEEVRQLLSSIYLDWGEIPPDFLVAAGPGEYDPSFYEEREPDPDEVWQGTYHEEGAELYPEWDFGRRHYRKNWCVMREKDVPPVFDDFVPVTLAKYGGVARHLRRTFEAMRDEDRLLKRQADGEDVDIDALVEALADSHDGREMTERLFTRMYRAERNIAVLFMVDMSGSTKGWINDAERESLVLLCEALDILGDRYGIYGFSGMTRKRCELYRIKRLEEAYSPEVKARISGIRPQDYTRMGFAIRHLNHLLKKSDATTKILITLSDGKPDDYNDYRGQYGIEDTRRALIESRRDGIHPYCITIDETARDYLPHLYGPAAFTVVSEVRQLPFKVSDIYRRLTT